jgi:hypothetical protein
MVLFLRSTKLLVIAVVLVVLSSWAGAGQNALKLEWVLSGPAIGGVTPSGKAVLDQPSLPGKLHCEVKGVNLPNSTVLSVSLGGYIAGNITLNQGNGKMDALVPFQFRNGAVEILSGSTTVMSGRFKN